MKSKLKKISPWWFLACGLLLASVFVWQAGRWTYQRELAALANTGEERLTLYTGTLRGALRRYAYLPYVLSRNLTIRELVEKGDPPEEVNRYLEDLNREAGSDVLYVMTADGTTLASSNWRLPLTFVGHNYGFRPYFREAQAGRQGRFFGIGVTTGKPGFFMSYPVRRDRDFLGAAVVRVDLDPLQEDWRQGGETVLVSDSNGVLFLSSRNDWKYSTLAPLTADQRKRIRAGRQYGKEPLDLAPLQTLQVLDKQRRIVRADGQTYLMLARGIPGYDWTLLHLAPLAPVLEQTRAVTIIGTILALLILALAMYARERRQKQLSRRQARAAEAIRQVNLRLQEEIAEHQRTEQTLRETQAELVQSSKLAALGQMAAGIVHELNQPISAIRTHAASGRLLLERKEIAQASETFGALARITEHMASITAQLKIFARKTPGPREQVVLQIALESALAMTAPLLQEVGVDLEKEVPTEPLVVLGGNGQIEQVLLNLIRNSIDAMREAPVRRLRIDLITDAKMLVLRVTDSGKGIAAEHLDELFNPFFTTKEVGQGLGLGLSISYRIVTDLGGTIRAKNNSDGGACFIVRLPLAEARS